MTNNVQSNIGTVMGGVGVIGQINAPMTITMHDHHDVGRPNTRKQRTLADV